MIRTKIDKDGSMTYSSVEIPDEVIYKQCENLLKRAQSLYGSVIRLCCMTFVLIIGEMFFIYWLINTERTVLAIFNTLILLYLFALMFKGVVRLNRLGNTIRDIENEMRN